MGNFLATLSIGLLIIVGLLTIAFVVFGIWLLLKNVDWQNLRNRIPLFRNPWIIGPVMSEIILSRARLHPERIDGITAILTDALRSKDKNSTEGLSLIVPGQPKHVSIQKEKRRIDMMVCWEPDIWMGGLALSLPRAMIPEAIQHSLAGRRLSDIADLPFCRTDRVLKENEIMIGDTHIELAIFRTEHTLEEMLKILKWSSRYKVSSDTMSDQMKGIGGLLPSSQPGQISAKARKRKRRQMGRI